MLRFSNEKIKDHRYKCGLGEPHYFSWVFRQMEGMSPLEYREKWRSEKREQDNVRKQGERAIS